MATIKIQPSGAVVLKDGKVACTCCAQPNECCMYPAQALVDGLYSVADLPDEILVTQILLELDQTLFTKTGDNQNFYTGTGVGGNTISVVIDSGEGMNGETVYVWALDFSGELFAINTNPFCLIFPPEVEGGTGTEDQFANSYTVTGPPGGPVTVTRQSLCVWTGSDSCGNEVRLEFLSYAEDSDYPYWFIGWLEYFGPVGDCNALDSSSGVKDPYAQDGDGIDTPVGNYYENVGQPPIGSVS